MAWGFEADPELEEQLQWMRDFIDTELIPLEPILRELPERRVGGRQASPAGSGEGAGIVGGLSGPGVRGRGLRAAEAGG